MRRISIARRDFVFRYESVDHFLDVFSTYYGPFVKALEMLDDAGAARLRDELTAVIERFNRADGSLVVPGEYLEIVAEK